MCPSKPFQSGEMAESGAHSASSSFSSLCSSSWFLQVGTARGPKPSAAPARIVVRGGVLPPRLRFRFCSSSWFLQVGTARGPEPSAAPARIVVLRGDRTPLRFVLVDLLTDRNN